jgi:hypothetical protein
MAKSSKQQTDTVLRARALSCVKKYGVREAARRIGLHHQTLVAIVAGLPVRKGSLALARQALCDGQVTL